MSGSLENLSGDEHTLSDGLNSIHESDTESVASVDETPPILDDTQALAVNARYSTWKAAKAAVIHHCFDLKRASPKANHSNNKTFKIWPCLVEGCPFRAYFV